MKADGTTAGADLFPLLRMRGMTCGYADLRAPWSLAQRGTERHWFYFAKKGSCWVEATGQSRGPIRLGEGDALAIANDSPHHLRHGEKPSREAAPALRVRSPGEREMDVGDADTLLFVASVARKAAPLSELFPTVFHVPADGSHSSRRIADLVTIAEDEIAQAPDEPGSSAVLDRLGDLLLIELLRVETRRVNQENPVWVGGIVDPEVARLITQLHAEPGRHWAWESMCQTAGLSRSALDRRFRAVLGQSPRSYLFGLRMRLAAAALAEGRKSISEIAADVGYESEPAFHRAFRRTLGFTPGAVKRTA